MCFVAVDSRLAAAPVAQAIHAERRGHRNVHCGSKKPDPYCIFK